MKAVYLWGYLYILEKGKKAQKSLLSFLFKMCLEIRAQMKMKQNFNKL